MIPRSPTLSTHFLSQDALPNTPCSPTAGPLPCSELWSSGLPLSASSFPVCMADLVCLTFKFQPWFFNEVKGKEQSTEESPPSHQKEGRGPSSAR